MKRILVLGAGLVCRPLVQYLTNFEDTEVTVASCIASEAEAMVVGRARGTAITLNVKDEEALEKQIVAHDIAVSLLPATEHHRVARLCLKHGKHMATTSYLTADMLAHDEEVKAKGLTFINECGVDPGLDHMSAMRVIHDAESKNGKVVSFRSYCGGLPAPEANTNPLGYKFSWSPRGVLAAATKPAKYMMNGEIVEIPGDELFAEPERVDVPGIGKFEGYPNRDSLGYIDVYGLKDIKTMFRGTLRNLGHCESWYHWVKMGLFTKGLRSDLESLTYLRFMQGFVDGAANVKKALAKKLNLPDDAPAITKLEWLGLMKDKPIPIDEGGNIDVMAVRMTEKCAFKRGERDMIVLQHEFLINYPAKQEKVYSTLVGYGIPNGDSAMARTVSLPVAIATRMILEGRITERGVIAPVKPEIYNAILDELATMDIVCTERVG